MKFLTAFLYLALSFTLSAQSKTVYETKTLKIEQIAQNSFVHVSYLQTQDFGYVACNGMVVIDRNEAIVFDTPTNDQVSEELIDWLKTEKQAEVKALVVTHFHVDCLGGISAFHSRGIPSYANHLTITLADKNNRELPKNGFSKSLKLTVGKKKVINTFIGEGHTKDNIVGYFPSEKVLFGGCLVKSVGASKGNLEDANELAWSQTMRDLKKAIPKVKIVVPGHGQTGNAELLDYTEQLFKP